MKQKLIGVMIAASLVIASCSKKDKDDATGTAVKIGDQITYEASATGGSATMIVGYYNEEINLITVDNAPSSGWSYTYTVKKDPTYVTFGANGGTGSSVTGRILKNGQEVKKVTSNFSINLTYP